MAQDRLATVTYRNDPPVCIFADGACGLARMRRTAQAAGCRVAALTQTGGARRYSCLPTATALIELDGGADEAGAIALLDWAQREAESGGRHIVVSAPRSLLDLVAARAPSRRVTQLCAASEAERIAAVASASGLGVPRLHDIGREEGPAILQQLTEDVSRIAAILASLSEEESATIVNGKGTEGADKEEPGIDSALVRSIIRARRLRDQYFRGGLFADPAWDMLLDLMAARLENNRVAVSSLCIAAAVPATTALRWIKALTDRGLFVRSADPQDGRRVYIELSDDAARGLTAYLRAVQRMAPTAI